MLNKLKEKFSYHKWPMIIILLASLTFLNFLKFNLYSMWDLTIPPFDPGLQMQKVLSIWDYSFLGGRHYAMVWNLPIFFTSKIISFIIPVNVGYTLFLSLLFFLSGLGMYLFVYSTVKLENKKYLMITALVSGLLYMFNPFWIFRLNSTLYTIYILAFLPFIFLFLRKALENGNDKFKSLKYILTSVVFFILMSPGLSNIPVAFATFLFLFLYLFGFAILNSRIKSFVITSAIALPLIIITQLWWFYPNLNHSAVKEGLSRSGQYQEDTLEGIKWWSETKYVSYYNILRNSAYYIRDKEHMSKSWGELWVNKANVYNSNFFIFISFLIPIGAFMTLLSRKIINKSDNVIFIGVLLFFIPLFALLKEPFGDIVKQLFLKVPIYILRRPPSYMFIFSFVYAYLFGIFIYMLMEKLGEVKNKLYKGVFKSGIILLIFLTVVVYAFPQWLGYGSYMNLKDNLSESGEEKIKPVSALVSVPDYVKEVIYFLNNEKREGGVLVLPRAGMLRGYDWDDKGYFGFDIYYLTLNRPVLSSSLNRYDMFYVYEHIDKLISSKQEKISKDELSKILAMLNIRYILVAEDTLRHNDTPFFKLTIIHDYLLKQNGIELIKEVGKIKIYENKLCDYSCNNFYVPKEIINLPENSDRGENIEKFINKYIEIEPTGKTVFIDMKKNNFFQGNQNVKIEEEKISPTKYKLEIHAENKEKFIVSSGLAFNNGWKAKVDNRELEQVKINSLFSGWVIDKDDINENGNLLINVFYEPQESANFVMKISFLAIVLIFVVFLILHLPFNYNKKS